MEIGMYDETMDYLLMLMESNENRHFEGPERVNVESLGDPVGAFTNNSFHLAA